MLQRYEAKNGGLIHSAMNITSLRTKSEEHVSSLLSYLPAPLVLDLRQVSHTIWKFCKAIKQLALMYMENFLSVPEPRKSPVLGFS